MALRVAVLLTLVAVSHGVELSARQYPVSGSGNGTGAGTGTGSNRPLPSNVQYITGNVPTQCYPTEYYYVDDSNTLYRKDQGSSQLVNITSGVTYAGTAWDDSLWYIDLSGGLWRLHYGQPQSQLQGPAGVQFQRVAPVGYWEVYAVTTTGDVYHYASYQWILLEKTSGPKTGISVGQDGFLLAANRDTVQLWFFDFVSMAWQPYATSGISADVFDRDHVVVVTDATSNNVVKKSGSNWVAVNQKCRRASAFAVDQFYCTAPDGTAVLVPY